MNYQSIKWQPSREQSGPEPETIRVTMTHTVVFGASGATIVNMKIIAIMRVLMMPSANV